MHTCKYIRRIGESCTLNNNCKYPNCDDMKTKKPFLIQDDCAPDSMDTFKRAFHEKTGMTWDSFMDKAEGKVQDDRLIRTYGVLVAINNCGTGWEVFHNNENPVRQQVYKAIDSEREYQDLCTASEDRPDMIINLPIGSAMLAMEELMSQARTTWYSDSPESGYRATMDKLRKVAGLIVQMGEQHGMPMRDLSMRVVKGLDKKDQRA